MNKEKVIQVLTMISEDAKKDVEENEGQPFTGHNVATMMGKQNAMIAALANIIKELLKEINYE